MFRLAPGVIGLVLAATACEAANLTKTYSYFTVRGSTLDQLEAELNSRGPEVKSTGRRHPGATQMTFSTRLSYGQKNGSCRVVGAVVTVKAKVILPRWNQRGRAGADLRLVWDTLSADIKRHEEAHVTIARKYAKELEQTLTRLTRQRDCEAVARRAKASADKILARHDKAQTEFDRVEGLGFERRILRLLKHRLASKDAQQGG